MVTLTYVWSSSFGQDYQLPGHKFATKTDAYEFYILKSKHQKTKGYICLISGPFITTPGVRLAVKSSDVLSPDKNN